MSSGWRRWAVACALLGIMLGGCASRRGNECRVFYTKVNLRYDKRRGKGSYIGYTKLKLLPVNSRVRVFDVWENGFSMELLDGQVIVVGYKEQWGTRDHASIGEIIPLLFSSTDISEELAMFDKVDREGIEDGVATVGMSKKGVVVALGHPAAHCTASLEGNI